VHDRRIEGRARVFGNQGWLYMRDMTWWDHETGSIWAQAIGTALIGPLRGTKLRVLPAALVPWSTWRAEHPTTRVLDEPGFAFFRERPQDDFVIGIALGEHARAYQYRDAAKARLINDWVGPEAVVVYTDANTRRVQTFLRQVRGQVLTFTLRGDQVLDTQTGSVWNLVRGISTAGSLRGEILRVIPHNSSYGWAWRDFYPRTTFYEATCRNP
jgi:hypothetical protein